MAIQRNQQDDYQDQNDELDTTPLLATNTGVDKSTSLQSVDESYVPIRISINDSGIGVPEDKINSLFQTFSQVDASTTRNFGGTGLGLAISRKLCRCMNGDMVRIFFKKRNSTKKKLFTHLYFILVAYFSIRKRKHIHIPGIIEKTTQQSNLWRTTQISGTHQNMQLRNGYHRKTTSSDSLEKYSR
jgi:DNA topoisomerase VI subunit B